MLYKLISKLHTTFSLKKLGIPQYFLGIKVHYQPSEAIILTQTKYIKDQIAKVNITEVKDVSTPMFNTCKLSEHGDDKLLDPLLYITTVSEFQYVTLTRLGIAFSVNIACQYMSGSLESHWSVVKHLLQYLNGTSSHGIFLALDASLHKLSLQTYSEYDWASDLDNKHSTSGSCVFLGPNFVARSSKKQLLLARSSTKSEYQALAHKTSEVLWIKSIVQELFIPYLPPKLLCGNLSVFMISHNPILHARTKHIELDIHFVREIINGNKLHIQYVPAQA